MEFYEILGKPEARNLERALQVASGAAWLGILTSLASVWGEIPASVGLRLALIDGLALFGFAFFVAVSCTVIRVFTYPAWATFHALVLPIIVIIWFAGMMASGILLFKAGAETVLALSNATHQDSEVALALSNASLQDSETALANTTKIIDLIDRIEEEIRRLEKASRERDAEIRSLKARAERSGVHELEIKNPE